MRLSQAIPKVLAARDFGPINLHPREQDRKKPANSANGEQPRGHMIEEYLGRLKADRDRHSLAKAAFEANAASTDASQPPEEEPPKWAE